MSKLKSIDFKSLLINHGEKFCLGLVALIGVFALVGTSWGTYKDTTPDAMIDKAKQTRNNMLASKFTEEDAKPFLTVDEGGNNPDIRKETAQLHAAVDLGRFDYSTDMTWPVIPRGEPIRAIEYVKPREVIVDAGRTLIPLNAQAAAELESAESDESMELASADGATDAEEEVVESEFDRRTGNRGGSLPGAASGYGAGYGEASAGYMGEDMMNEDADDEGDYDTDYSQMYGAEEAGGYMGGGPGAAAGLVEKPVTPSRGVHYAAVRAIFPIREQQRKVADAMGLSPTDPTLEQLVYVTNFVVERQTAVRGSDPWTGEWEQIDIQTALDVLDDADGIEPDVVRPEVTDPAVTMPLPPRMVGYWKDGSHPELETFQMSELDQDLLNKHNELLLEYGKEEAADADVVGPARKGGFSRSQIDINSYQLGAGAAGMDGYTNAMKEYTTKMGEQLGGKTDLGKRLKVLDGATASGHLLLVRFLDFTVTPGRKYKYRVRVELRNPLFNLPIEELENPELASRQSWQTEWSDPSDPVFVPNEYDYFVDSAEDRPGRETQAKIDVFQWFREAGSLINGVLKVYPGQFIGERKKTEVLRFAAETFKEETVEFSTDDLLLDVAGSIEIDPDDHPYLKVPKARGGFRLPAEILVMNNFHQVEASDSVSKMKDRQAAQTRYGEMVAANEDLKQAAMAANADDAFGYGGGEEEDEGEMYGNGMPGSSRGRSSRRSRRRRSSLMMDGGDF